MPFSKPIVYSSLPSAEDIDSYESEATSFISPSHEKSAHSDSKKATMAFYLLCILVVVTAALNVILAAILSAGVPRNSLVHPDIAAGLPRITHPSPESARI